MRKCIIWFLMLFKRQLKKISVYAILIIMIMACFAIKYAADNFKVVIEIGVVNEDTGNVSKMIEKGLYAYKGLISFRKFASCEELERNVMSGSIIGGYVLKENFSEKLLEGETGEIIQALSTPNSLAASMANEIFFSFVMKEISYEELVKDTEDTGLFKRLTEEEIRSELRKYYDINLSDGSTFSLNYEGYQENYEGTAVNIDTYDYISPIITGIVGLMIFIGGMCGIMNWYDDMKKGSMSMLRPAYRQAAALAEAAIPVIIITAVGAVISGFLGLEESFPGVIGKYILYDFIVIIYFYILKTIIKKKAVYVSMIPVLILMSVIFCPVFINVASIAPGLGEVGRFLPLYWLYIL